MKPTPGTPMAPGSREAFAVEKKRLNERRRYDEPRLPRANSSARYERSADNREVLGSNPSWPTRVPNGPRPSEPGGQTPVGVSSRRLRVRAAAPPSRLVRRTQGRAAVRPNRRPRGPYDGASVAAHRVPNPTAGRLSGRLPCRPSSSTGVPRPREAGGTPAETAGVFTPGRGEPGREGPESGPVSVCQTRRPPAHGRLPRRRRVSDPGSVQAHSRRRSARF